jgi:hypothetical protein
VSHRPVTHYGEIAPFGRASLRDAKGAVYETRWLARHQRRSYFFLPVDVLGVERTALCTLTVFPPTVFEYPFTRTNFFPLLVSAMPHLPKVGHSLVLLSKPVQAPITRILLQKCGGASAAPRGPAAGVALQERAVAAHGEVAAFIRASDISRP